MRKFADAIARLGPNTRVLAIAEDGGAVSSAGLNIIFSNGMNWDHVSVAHPDRCPTWIEMEAVKRAFFRERETAMQFHVPPSDHINFHPYCLHLWRPQRVKIPRPPGELVGPKQGRVA